MKGLQGFAYQKNNLVPSMAIDHAISPSAKIPLVYPIVKKGNGNIRVQGSYSGALDAKYEVKILDSAFTSPVVSSPVFRGAGTGVIRDIVAQNLAAQKIRVLCMSTGVTTQKAEIEIEGVRFRAKQTGAQGNNIYITVDDSALVYTDSTYSTIKDLKTGDTGLEGQEWDWDTKILLGDIVPDSAHRVAFGSDKLHIYRQYKKFESGVYRYYFIRPIRYDVKAGSKVYFVTGGRTVTVTDGVVVEQYPGIVTIADLWAAVRDASLLIEPVESAIDTSKTVDSPAVRELAVKTSAYALPSYKGEKSSEHAGELRSVTVNASTKTELISATCVDNSYIGQEIWAVLGSTSGELGQAKTGDYNEFGPAGFTIPQKFPADWGVIKEDWSHKVTYVGRGAGINPPPICFAMALGIMSKPQTLTLEYKRKPPSCICPPVTFSQLYLGFEEKGGEIGMAYTVPDLDFWTDVAIERMREAFRSAATQMTGEAEKAEGREAASSPNWFQSFTSATAQYVRMFKALGQRIMALPENVPATLTQMVTDYKDLVHSLVLWSYNQGTPVTASWSDLTGAWSDNTLLAIDDVRYDLAKYKALVDSVLDYEKTYGVKKNSVVSSEDGSYQDSDSEYYWEVRGEKAYLPAYTDIPYYSTVKSGDKYVNTKEFALKISVPCGGSLIEGDVITVTIGGIEFERTYKVGDITYLPTVAAQALALTGGIDGDDTYVWEVRGEIDTFPDYLLDRDNPQPYNTLNLDFAIDDGIVMFQVGDRFEINIEGGHWAWRKDGGAWSAAKNIDAAFQLLDSGIEIAFDFGVAPSFVLDDLWEILATQENRAANMAEPWKTKTKGTGNIVLSAAAPVTVDTLIVDLHNLSGQITFQASDVADFSVLVHDEIIPVTGLICRLYLDTPITARYFRIVKATENEMGYLFLGQLLQISGDADSIVPVTKYRMQRQEGREPFSAFRSKNKGYKATYTYPITNADFQSLAEMVDYSKLNNDMPLYFIPNAQYEDECLRAWIDTDNIEPDMDKDMSMTKENRLYTLTVPIIGV